MKEKQFYVVVAVIAIILIGVIVFANWGKKEPEQNNNQNQNQTVKNNAPAEEFVNNLPDGTKVNTSQKFSQKRTVDGLEVSNIKLTENGNVSLITADVKNNTSEKKGDYGVKLTILDKEGKTIVEVNGYIDAVAAGKTVQLNTSATADFANAYDFKIEKK